MAAIKIDLASADMRASKDMKRSVLETSAFSLVEVTLALGVAAFCLIAVLGLLPTGLKTQQTSVHETIANKILSEMIGDMRAAVRVHGNGNGDSSNYLIHLPPQSGSPWNPRNQLPSTAYFTNEGNYQQGSNGAVFTANINYRWTDARNTTALAHIIVYWPSQQADLTLAAGSVETLVNLNRPAP
jgi:type II secretory pathway pseudopilin PulG